MAPPEYEEEWIPGLRLTAHPGMTTRESLNHFVAVASRDDVG